MVTPPVHTEAGGFPPTRKARETPQKVRGERQGRSALHGGPHRGATREPDEEALVGLQRGAGPGPALGKRRPGRWAHSSLRACTPGPHSAASRGPWPRGPGSGSQVGLRLPHNME